MRGLQIGIGILILAGIIAYVVWSRNKSNSEITIKGIVGSEKSYFLENQKVKKKLKDKYGITVDYSREGSIEMVTEQVKNDIDFLWPSSQVALEIFKNKQSSQLVKSELVFNSPIVIYSWDIVVNALIKQGIVKKSDSTYYVVDMPKLLNYVLSGKKWSDIGLPELYGRITISTTDPEKSNSGIMFAGLVANILNGDLVDNNDSLMKVLPKVKEIFLKQGYMQSSSGYLFEQFLKTGVGQYPMIVGYENQIVEFSLMHPDFWPEVKNKMKILYPAPTVWSEHPVIITNKKALPLLDALNDEEVQKLAWQQHGFRTGLTGIQNDMKLIQIEGVPQTVNKIVPIPRAFIMERIIAELANADSITTR